MVVAGWKRSMDMCNVLQFSFLVQLSLPHFMTLHYLFHSRILYLQLSSLSSYPRTTYFHCTSSLTSMPFFALLLDREYSFLYSESWTITPLANSLALVMYSFLLTIVFIYPWPSTFTQQISSRVYKTMHMYLFLTVDLHNIHVVSLVLSHLLQGLTSLIEILLMVWSFNKIR